MLVLSRKKNESIVVGPDGHSVAEICVVEIRGDKVRLGIVVPKEWKVVHRREVWDALNQPGQEPPQPPGS